MTEENYYLFSGINLKAHNTLGVGGTKMIIYYRVHDFSDPLQQAFV